MVRHLQVAVQEVVLVVVHVTSTEAVRRLEPDAAGVVQVVVSLCPGHALEVAADQRRTAVGMLVLEQEGTLPTDERRRDVVQPDVSGLLAQVTVGSADVTERGATRVDRVDRHVGARGRTAGQVGDVELGEIAQRDVVQTTAVTTDDVGTTIDDVHVELVFVTATTRPDFRTRQERNGTLGKGIEVEGGEVRRQIGL